MMDFFRKERLLYWCVIVLILLNIVLAVSFWLKRPPFPPPGAGRQQGRHIMEEQLQLSEAQVLAFEQIRDEHFAFSDPLNERLNEIRMALLDEIFTVEPNEATIAELCAEIGQTQCQFDTALFNHFRDLKNICRDQQVIELKQLLTNLLQEMLENRRLPDPKQTPPGPGRGPGPGHPPPPRQ